jgi:urease accessory protein
MADLDLARLAMLQLADSAFPSGAYTLSHGLETLVAEGLVRDVDELAAALEVALVWRLGRADLPALGAAWAAPDIQALINVDRRLAAVKLAREEREASMRVGRRLAVEVARLADSPIFEAYRLAIELARTPGNAAVALGAAGRALGIARRDVLLMAGYGFANGFLSAALRLGRIGHGQLQRLLREAAPTIAAAADRAETIDPDELFPSAPMFDVALAMHETAPVRLFAT